MITPSVSHNVKKSDYSFAVSNDYTPDKLELILGRDAAEKVRWRSDDPVRIIVYLTGLLPAALVTMTLSEGKNIERVLRDMSDICEGMESAPSPGNGWDWLTDPLMRRGYQIDRTGFLIRACRYSAAVEVEIRAESNEYGIQCWSKNQDMYEGLVRGSIKYEPDFIGREFLLEQINWNQLPVVDRNGNPVSDLDSDSCSHSPLTWSLADFNAFAARASALSARMLSMSPFDNEDEAYLTDAFAVTEEAEQTYAWHISGFKMMGEASIMQMRERAHEALENIEKRLDTIEKRRCEAGIIGVATAMSNAADATDDMRFITEYAGHRYGPPPLSPEDDI